MTAYGNEEEDWAEGLHSNVRLVVPVAERQGLWSRARRTDDGEFFCLLGLCAFALYLLECLYLMVALVKILVWL